MAYGIRFNLPEGWNTREETYFDESGSETTHLTATVGDKRRIDVYVGDLPDGETAEDQAFANYAEGVGFDDGDDDGGNPILKFRMNGKTAYGFDALTEDDLPMRLISQEVRKGVIAIITYFVENDEALDEVFSLIERNLRVGGK